MEKKIQHEIVSRSGRGASYPGLNLEEALARTSELYKKLGPGPYSREEVAVGLGYSGLSGASVRAVAALGHYGLLDRLSSSTYAISSLGEEIIHPTDESGIQRAKAITLAVATPKLFERLINKFQNQALPTLLENILLREGINRSSVKEVAEIFRQSLQFAGLLKNGVVVGHVSSLIKENEDPMLQKTDLDLISETKIAQRQQGLGYGTSEAGDGWTIAIKSQNPLNSGIRKALVELIDKLEQNSEKEQ